MRCEGFSSPAVCDRYELPRTCHEVQSTRRRRDVLWTLILQICVVKTSSSPSFYFIYTAALVWAGLLSAPVGVCVCV